MENPLPLPAAAAETAEVYADLTRLPGNAARMAAVEVLLADPQALGDDVLESSLYILREKLRSA